MMTTARPHYNEPIRCPQTESKHWQPCDANNGDAICPSGSQAERSWNFWQRLRWMRHASKLQWNYKLRSLNSCKVGLHVPLIILERYNVVDNNSCQRSSIKLTFVHFDEMKWRLHMLSDVGTDNHNASVVTEESAHSAYSNTMVPR